MTEAATMTLAEASAALGLTPLKLSKAIHDGLVPIGFVLEGEPGTKERTRTVILRQRFIKYVNGDDMIPQCTCGKNMRRSETNEIYPG